MGKAASPPHRPPPPTQGTSRVRTLGLTCFPPGARHCRDSYADSVVPTFTARNAFVGDVATHSSKVAPNRREQLAHLRAPVPLGNPAARVRLRVEPQQ